MPMTKPLWVVAGLVLVAMGLVWTLQGFGVIGGSGMSDSTFWAVVGLAVVAVGALLASVGFRGRKP